MAQRFDLYQKPWPHGVTTVIGDIGVPHPVIVGVQGNVNLNHGDWIVYMPIGEVVMTPELFSTIFGIKEPDAPFARVQPLDVIVPPLKASA